MYVSTYIHGPPVAPCTCPREIRDSSVLSKLVEERALHAMMGVIIMELIMGRQGIGPLMSELTYSSRRLSFML